MSTPNTLPLHSKDIASTTNDTASDTASETTSPPSYASTPIPTAPSPPPYASSSSSSISSSPPPYADSPTDPLNNPLNDPLNDHLTNPLRKYRTADPNYIHYSYSYTCPANMPRLSSELCCERLTLHILKCVCWCLFCLLGLWGLLVWAGWAETGGGVVSWVLKTPKTPKTGGFVEGEGGSV